MHEPITASSLAGVQCVRSMYALNALPWDSTSAETR